MAFRQALVDEALHRTPKGGFPELEERHQLAPGTLFDWVKELGPAPPPTPFSALHFWLGNTPLDEATFYNYFAGKKCGFCKDLHTRYRYDEDLLLIIYLPEPVPVEKSWATALWRATNHWPRSCRPVQCAASIRQMPCLSMPTRLSPFLNPESSTTACPISDF